MSNRFDQFCETSGKSNLEIGAELVISDGYVGKLRSGKQKPGAALTLTIFQWSGGYVTANSWHKEMLALAQADPDPDASQNIQAAE